LQLFNTIAELEVARFKEVAKSVPEETEVPVKVYASTFNMTACGFEYNAVNYI
jgi:hypothetical protein